MSDITGNFRRDGDGITFGKGVIGADLIFGHQPPDQCHDHHHHYHNPEDDQGFLAGAFTLFIVILFTVVGIFLVFGILSVTSS